MKPGKKGISRIKDAFKYSWHGFKATFKTEEAFRQELFLCAILLPIAFFLDVSKVERLFLISSLIIVLLMELVNSAVEAVVDRISDDYHDLSKKAKDIGSLLVLVSFSYVLFTWLFILL